MNFEAQETGEAEEAFGTQSPPQEGYSSQWTLSN